MKFIKNTKHLIIILLTLTISIFIGYGISVAGWMDGITSFGDKDHGYRTNTSKSFEIKDLPYDKGAYGQGYKVTNTSGKDYFIPTKTKTEWDAFKTHKPSGVSLESIKKKVSWYPKCDKYNLNNGTLPISTESSYGKSIIKRKKDIIHASFNRAISLCGNYVALGMYCYVDINNNNHYIIRAGGYCHDGVNAYFSGPIFLDRWK